MADAITLPTTQRAYTLRLRGINDSDPTWREALWATHEAVNKGAKVFGDWLLTLRGGLDHKLADSPVKEGDDKARPPTDADRRDRRILLALSWLSVEDAHGAPQDESLIVAKGTDSSDCRAVKLCDALAGILKTRGVADAELGDPNKRPEDQPGTWLKDCMPSLSAAIHDKAVWVNRNTLFDSFTFRISASADREYAAFTVLRFLELKGPYFVLPASEDDGATNDSKPTEDKPLVNEATGWLCENWGAGVKSDKEAISGKLAAFANADLMRFVGKPGTMLVQELCRLTGANVASPHDHSTLVKSLCRFVGWKGRKSAGRMAIESASRLPVLTHEALETLTAKLRAESEDKLAESRVVVPAWMPTEREYLESLIGMPYRGDKDHTFEFAVLLDHALRKVSSAHSWIKNAEAERRQFENDAQRLGNVPPQALEWLRQYCEERAGTSGSLDAYRIRKRAIDGWDKVVDRWARADCQTADDRTTAARQLQDDPDDKFGDIQLFEALAAEDALCVWKPDGKSSSQPLKDFVAATDAEAKQKRFKVPAYRHPDPLKHPVFCDFGNSRWGIDFSAHRAPAKLREQQQTVQKLSSALAEAERKLASARETQRETRQTKVVECRDKLRKAEQELGELSDHHRLELKLWNGQAVEPIPLRWTCKRLVADLALRSTNGDSRENRTGVPRADRLGRAAVGANGPSGVNITGLFQQDHWNGRLQAPRVQLDAIARHVEKHGWDAKARKLVERIRWLVSFSAELTQLGPWTEYCDRFGDDAPAKPFMSRKGDYAVKHRENDQRKGHSKLILPRLPGLRLLSVDLGHRYAAACAVWEAITQGQMQQACTNAGVAPPDANTMYVTCGEKARLKSRPPRSTAASAPTCFLTTRLTPPRGPGSIDSSLSSYREKIVRRGRLPPQKSRPSGSSSAGPGEFVPITIRPANSPWML